MTAPTSVWHGGVGERRGHVRSLGVPDEHPLCGLCGFFLAHLLDEPADGRWCDRCGTHCEKHPIGGR